MEERENVEVAIVVFEVFVALREDFLCMFVGEGDSLENFEFLVEVSSDEGLRELVQHNRTHEPLQLVYFGDPLEGHIVFVLSFI